mgnify:CR=1 FL=1
MPARTSEQRCGIVGIDVGRLDLRLLGPGKLLLAQATHVGETGSEKQGTRHLPPSATGCFPAPKGVFGRAG